MKTNCLVYRVVSPSGKSYIGITSKTINARIAAHKYDAKRFDKYRFHRAINKYGFDAFSVTVLKSGLSRDLAIKYERYYIRKFDSYLNGYNDTLGGEGAFGHRRVDIESMRQRTKNRFSDPAERAKQSERTKAYFKNNPEQRKMRGKSLLTFRSSEEGKLVRRQVNEKLGSFENRLANSRRRGGRPILVFRKSDNTFIKRYDIMSEAARELGCSTSKITMVLRGQRTHTKGFYFKYE